MNDIMKTLSDYFRKGRPDLTSGTSSLEYVPLNKLIDSIEMLDLLAFIEESFNVQIEESDVDSKNFQNISSVASMIKRKKKKFKIYFNVKHRYE